MRAEWIGPDVRLHPAGPVSGTPRLPGSKSIANRLLTCTALADGRSELRGVSLSDDVRAMIAGLRQLGIRVDVPPDREADAVGVAARPGPRPLEGVVVHGCRGYPPADEAEIDVGGAGTAMRFLTALACLGHGEYRLDGSPRMRARPIEALVSALRELGARVGYEEAEGYPPLRVLAAGLGGGEVRFETPPSSQFISALLMVGPYAQRDVLIAVDGALPSEPYVDMTVDVMRSCGVELLAEGGRRFIVPAFQQYRGGRHTVEPDASAATYFWAAAALTGGRVRVPGLARASRQGDARFVDVLAEMGCTVNASDDGLEVAAPLAGRLRGVSVDLNAMPDTVQTLAVLALHAAGPTEIRNVANLRIKETDRIAALASELGKLGAGIETRPDGLTVNPPATLTPAAIETFDDHRMAMSFALAGLTTEGITIRDAGCVSKSFPGFFEVLNEL